MTTITTSITEQKKIEFKNSHTKKSNNHNMTTIIIKIDKKNKNTAISRKKKTAEPWQESFNITTCSTRELHDAKTCSYDYPLGLEQIMNYPFIFSKQGWLAQSDSSINNFKADLEILPVKKRHLYKAYTIIDTGQRLKTIWDAEEERFKCLRSGEWVYIVGSDELNYNIKMLHTKDWCIRDEWIDLCNKSITDKDAIFNTINDDIEKNRTGNADGRARKVKNSKSVQVYMS